MRQLKVLIVEDSETDEKILLRLLKKGDYEVQSETVCTVRAFKEALKTKNWEIVIADYDMPDFDGIEAYQILQTANLDIPFIILSGVITEEIGALAMNAGISDYINKKDTARLMPVIARELKSAENRRSRIIAEKTSQENFERFRSLFEDANDMIFTINLDGIYTSINKTGEQLLGYSRSEILNSEFCKFLNEHDAKKVRKMRAQKIAGKSEESHYELNLVTKNGEEKIVEISSKIVNKDGKLFEIQGIARDITNRQKLLTDLSESEKRLNLALTAARMGAWEWNMRNDEVFWSEECYSILRQKTFGGYLNDFLKIVHPDDVDVIRDKINRAVRERETFIAEYRIVSSEGEIIWIFDQGIAEYDDQGTPLRCIGTFREITAQKQLEQNLTATEARFRTLAESSVAGVTLCKAGGNLIFANDAYLNIVGYSREDFENGLIKWNEITAPEFAEADKMSIEQARQHGKSPQYEKEYLRKDGSRVPVLVAIALSEIDGEEYFISAILDFTDRKKTEKKLNESVEDFRALVEATSQIIWTMTDGIVNAEFMNFWKELTGQTFRQAKDHGWFAVVHPDDREHAGRLWMESFANNTQFNSVYRVLTVNGKYNYYAVRGVPVFKENGELRKWIGAFSNITERKKVEEELRESEARLQLSQQAGRIGTWELNVKKDELIWSDVIYSFYDLERGEKEPNLNLFESFIHPDDLAQVRNDMAKYFQGNNLIDCEYRIISHQKNLRWISTKGRVIRQPNGEVERMIGVSIDITDRKTAEDKLHASEEKLRQAQKLESIGRLAGGIAHDFNNMLTAINGYSELVLRRMQEDDPMRSFINEIKKAGERSAELTHQLLAFSRRQILQPKVLNLNQIVSDTTVMLQRLIGENIRLVEKFSSEIGRIEADPGQITQVIMNLAVNARDAMPNGGILTIETENVFLDENFVKENQWGREGYYVLLKVSDSGNGIDDEVLENIFEPFFTTKEIGSGTGLGLATVYGIIKQSGGHINVRTKANQGTTFEIFLPKIRDEIISVEKPDNFQVQLTGGETILVVEDEEIVRRLTCEILESYGYQVIEAKNGEDALKTCQNDGLKFDLLLTDVVMPKTGGHELAKKLLTKYPNLRVLFASGYTEDSQLQFEITDAVTDFIHKPFMPNALAVKVRDILDRN